MSLNENNIHEGHRARMRAKYLEHGERIFDTYELLEMLLYYVIPYKDTNPIAKRLLMRFGDIDGVMSAPIEELALVSGVGERCAELIHEAGRAFGMGEATAGTLPDTVLDTYDKAGEFFVDYFERNTSTNVAAVLLDNCMRQIKVVDIPVESFGTAAMKSRYIIDPAMRLGATVVMVAFVHRGGVAHAFASEMETSRMIRDELLDVDLLPVEQFVIGDGKYYSCLPKLKVKSAPSPEFMRYIRSRREEKYV